uniref:Uncharacterized protein n=1 Tax=Anas platyrhynchos platyrhynchos TaxID=8840 RepID=A0A493TNF6_ANAPP
REHGSSTLLSFNFFFPQIRNYGGVYVGLPSDAAAIVSSQTKAAPKGIGRLCIVFLLFSQFNFI